MNLPPLPRQRLHNMHHWREHVSGDLDEKNAAAKKAYYSRASKAGHMSDTQAYTNKILSGIEAKKWIFNDGQAAA